ncbi:Six-hairpin glycosidase-like protein [Xylogone sp. PMI_703]|nr:Six-hairpin glycosidase-like protein [Xylogone sp. PMI_703]
MFVNVLVSVLSMQVISAESTTLNVLAIAKQMVGLARSSWEFGTAAEALLELHNPSLSVFGATPFVCPAPSIEALKYASQYIYLDHEALIPGDGSSSDPASLGVFAIMLSHSDSRYAVASKNQATTLLTKIPRWWNGAISHRVNSAALWADFIYMGPPFLAYYAASSNDPALLEDVVSQCGLYRDVLQKTDGLIWDHIAANDSSKDYAPWSTSNGWAAAGMTRVLATVLKTGMLLPPTKSRLAAKLECWIQEIIDGAVGSKRGPPGLLHNYLDDESTLAETSGTALLAAVVYRMAVIAPEVFNEQYISWADHSRAVIAKHVNTEGIIAPAVKPTTHKSNIPYTAGSPEGQAFAVMLYSAHRDCVAAAVCSS